VLKAMDIVPFSRHDATRLTVVSLRSPVSLWTVHFHTPDSGVRAP